MKRQKSTSHNRFELGHIAGLRITMHVSVLVTIMFIWAGLRLITLLVTELSVVEGVAGCLIAVMFHYLSEFVHQLGHSIAARRTGYPMVGIYFFGPLGLSIYPKDEPKLSGHIHIQRALGGPIISLLLTIIVGVILALQTAQGGIVWWLLVFLFVDNLAVFTLGALLPLGFTDGSTILNWWGK